MKKVLGAIACLFAMASLPVAAQADGYFGINYTHTNSKYLELKTGDVTVRLGGEINQYFEAELRAAKTVATDTTVSGNDFGFDARIGGYLKLLAPLGIFRPYLIAGHTWNRESTSVTHGGDRHAYTDDWSYGAGLDLDITDSIGINAEYMILLDDTRHIDAYSAGVYYRF